MDTQQKCINTVRLGISKPFRSTARDEVHSPGEQRVSYLPFQFDASHTLYDRDWSSRSLHLCVKAYNISTIKRNLLL